MLMTNSPFLKTAVEAALAGAEVIKYHYQSNISAHLKADRTPVTVADVETEQVIKSILQQAFPDHGFWGEETGCDRDNAEYVWLVDPIDGTKSFVREYPFFSTQIALRHGNEFILGVSNAPLFDELAYAEIGSGAFLNEQPLQVSTIREFADATLSFGNVKTLTGDRRWTVMGELVQRFNRVRGYGDFYHYHLLAAGKIDLVIESDINILDIAALSVIVREAGGVVTDLAGAPLAFDTTSVLAGNPWLHQRVLEKLTAQPQKP